MSRRSQVFRRFRLLRLRMLLYKQDEVTQLEEKLEKLDQNDPKDLFLGNRRRDQNGERQKVLEELDKKLAAYGMLSCSWFLKKKQKKKKRLIIEAILIDDLLNRSQRTVNYVQANSRAVTSLIDWTSANPDIGRKETAFLHKHDLMTLAMLPDEAMTKLEPLVEKTSLWLHNLFNRARTPSLEHGWMSFADMIVQSRIPTRR